MDFIKTFNEIAEQVLPVVLNYRKNITSLNIDLKEDKTYVTQADFEIQKIIIDIILKHDPNANFIAEEKNVVKKHSETGIYTWVIDPIDGTRPFINSQSKEYCSVVCVIKERKPIASMVLLPELGIQGKHILIIGLLDKNEIYINGKISNNRMNKTNRNFVSVTRSSDVPPYGFENKLIEKRYNMKLIATSQTIDQLRTALDISDITDSHLESFDFFCRSNQKLWDGAAGMCFNMIANKRIVDMNGNNLIPFKNGLLEMKEPVHKFIFIGNSM